jgi:hypothetical protein
MSVVHFFRDSLTIDETILDRQPRSRDRRCNPKLTSAAGHAGVAVGLAAAELAGAEAGRSRQPA